MSEGILVGSDASYERLLPWWYSHLKKDNDTPIAILDFGMSPWGLAQAKKIGTIIDATAPPNIKVKCKVSYAQRISQACLKRIKHMKRSPFDTTLWLDLDCIVRCNVKPLFAYADHPSGFAAVFNDDIIYEIMHKSKRYGFNGGVHVVKKTSPIYDLWIKVAIERADDFYYDDVILSEALTAPIGHIPIEYNSYSSNAKIKHLVGEWGKKILFSDPNYRHQFFEPFEEACSDDFGIVLRVDEETEPFIDWWMTNYRMYNNFPVSINKNKFPNSLELTPCHIVQGHLSPSTEIWDYMDREIVYPSVKIIHYSGIEGRLALIREIMIGSMIHKTPAGERRE